MMKQKNLKPLATNPVHQGREKQAAFIREQIYGSFTLLAVNFGLLFKEDPSVRGAFIVIISTALGLWFASLLATIISYRVVHERNIPRREFISEVAIHRGLIAAAIPSLLMLTIASARIIEVDTAILASIALAIIGMTVAILRSAKTGSNSLVTALISIAIQGGIVALIVLMKLGSK